MILTGLGFLGLTWPVIEILPRHTNHREECDQTEASEDCCLEDCGAWVEQIARLLFSGALRRLLQQNMASSFLK